MANRNRVVWGRFSTPKYAFSWDFGAPGGVRDNLNLTHSPLGLWLFGMLPEATKALAFVAEGSGGGGVWGGGGRKIRYRFLRSFGWCFYVTQIKKKHTGDGGAAA